MLKRVLTAGAVIPAVIITIISGGNIFFAFTFLVAVMALKEFFCMALPDGSNQERWFAIVTGCFIFIAFYLDSQLSVKNSCQSYFLSTASCVLSFMALFFYHIFQEPGIKTFNRLAIKFFGIYYITLLFSYVILIRSLPEGVCLLFFLLFVTWAGDTGAYIVGTWKGKRPFFSKISPNKTVEGALGGLVSGVMIAILCKLFFLQQISIWHCLMLGIGINFMNQTGDLSESIIKRSFGAKDSGAVLPGHGGVLDRIDSLLFAAPFLFYYIKIVMRGI